MLGLEIDSPLNGILKVSAALLEKLYRLGISDLLVFAVSEGIKSVKESLFNEAVEEFKLLTAVLHYVANDELYHIPSELHIVVKIGKRYLGLYHPELSGVSCRVGVLRAEGRTKGIYLAVSQSVCLSLKLSRNREVCGLAEEVL